MTVEIVRKLLQLSLSRINRLPGPRSKVHGICAQDLAGAPRFWSFGPKSTPPQRPLAGGPWFRHRKAVPSRLSLSTVLGLGLILSSWPAPVWPAMKSFALGDLILDLGLEEDLRRTFPGFRWHDALSDAMASLVLLRRSVAEAKVETQEAEVLLRPDASHYHRLKAPGHPPRSGSRSRGHRGLRREEFPVSDI